MSDSESPCINAYKTTLKGLFTYGGILYFVSLWYERLALVLSEIVRCLLVIHNPYNWKTFQLLFSYLYSYVLLSKIVYSWACTMDLVSLPPEYVSSLTFWLYFVGFVKTMIYVKSARNNQRLFTMMSMYSSSSNTQQHSIQPSHSSCMNSISDSKTGSNWQSRRISGKNAHYTVKVYTCAETKRSGYYIFGIKKMAAW